MRAYSAQLERLVGWLADHPSIAHRREGDEVWIQPPAPGGFGITARPTESGFGDGLTVLFAADETGPSFLSDYEASDVEGPLKVVQLGLSGRARLWVAWRGLASHQVSVEVLEREGWESQGWKWSPLFPLWFWAGTRVTVYQNPPLVSAPRDAVFERA